MLKAKDMRQRVADPGDAEDQYRLAAADANIAVTLLAENSAEEALPHIWGMLGISGRDNRDIYLANLKPPLLAPMDYVS